VSQAARHGGDLDGEMGTVAGLAVTVFGPRDAEPVLMSAGLGGHGAYWQPQVAALARRYRVILYDHRGTGHSERTLSAPYGVTDMAADIERILDGLSIPSAHVVGHAAGGIAGLELARVAPQRVASLTIVNGWAKADPYFKRCFEIRLALYESGGAAAYLRAQPLFLFPAEWISARLEEMDRQIPAQAAEFQDEAVLRLRIKALGDFDVLDTLAGIGTPTLLVSAKDDMLVPAHCSSVLAKGLPVADHVQMAWGGHGVNVTDPEGFNRYLLPFLEAQALPAASLKAN
jgi:aminoacrylate hydrolase